MKIANLSMVAVVPLLITAFIGACDLMKPGMALDDISDELLVQCSALVKANSIVGCKVR